MLPLRTPEENGEGMVTQWKITEKTLFEEFTNGHQAASYQLGAKNRCADITRTSGAKAHNQRVRIHKSSNHPGAPSHYFPNGLHSKHFIDLLARWVLPCGHQSPRALSLRSLVTVIPENQKERHPSTPNTYFSRYHSTVRRKTS